MIYRNGKPSDITIEKDIPVPKPTVYSMIANDSVISGAKKMAIGDSILLKTTKGLHMTINLKHMTGFTFTHRSIGGCIRIWRIK
jgi:hypothetical protein